MTHELRFDEPAWAGDDSRIDRLSLANCSIADVRISTKTDTGNTDWLPSVSLITTKAAPLADSGFSKEPFAWNTSSAMQAGAGEKSDDTKGPPSKVVTTHNPDGSTTSRRYDDGGRLRTQVRGYEGRSHTSEYDENGKVTKESVSGYGRLFEREYGDKEPITRLTTNHADGSKTISTKNPNTNIDTFEMFDHRGKYQGGLQRETYANKHSLSTFFNSDRQKTTSYLRDEKEAPMVIASFREDGTLKKQEIYDALGTVTDVYYDSKGIAQRRRYTVDPKQRSWTDYFLK